MLYLLALLGSAYADDLIVDGKDVVLDGTSSWEHVRVINGGRLLVKGYDGSAGGMIYLVADTIEVDAKSAIVGSAAGYRGVENESGEGPGGGEGGAIGADGGGGGGYGGSGGGGSADECAYRETRGGKRYGDEDPVVYVDMGSAGGSAGTKDGDYGGFGGNGGAAIMLQARVVSIAGTIESNGANGLQYARDSAGGGAGGGIGIKADQLVCTGVLSAHGGDGYPGDDGGGGGGGGVVKQIWDGSGTPCTVDVSPGANGCGYESNPGIDLQTVADWDGDGFSSLDGDCGTADAKIYPGAIDVCDGLDGDCDSLIDEDAETRTYYLDADGDDHGDPIQLVFACREPEGAARTPDDCDDGNDLVFPGAREWCDGLDNDCDGGTDESAVDAPLWYRDADNDGYGIPDVTERACVEVTGWAPNDRDCDDQDPSVFPTAIESNNDMDDDCDGIVDEGTQIDVDGDALGDRDGDFAGGACDSGGGRGFALGWLIALGLVARRRR